MAPAEAPHPPPEPAHRRFPPPGGNLKGATGPATMIVPAETTVRLIAGPTAPRSGMLSHDRRGVPQAAQPPPLQVVTVPPPGVTTTLASTRSTPPLREGPMGGGTTLTGADVGPPAHILPSACAMMRQTQGAGLIGGPGRLPIPALHI